MNPDGSVNWYYVFATLIIRWIGVFILLATLALEISIMGKIMTRIPGNKENKVNDEV